jgi:hypothetical protein
MTRIKKNRHKEVVAYCWRNGVIEFGPCVPISALALIYDERKVVLAVIRGKARLAHDNKTWLVPNVPEAESEEAAYKAVHDFATMLHRERQDRILKQLAEIARLYKK